MTKYLAYELAQYTREELAEAIEKIDEEILELRRAKERVLVERSKRDFELHRNSG